jgi:outer membrane protein assembly factor BamB
MIMGTTIVVGTESGNVYFMDNTGGNVRPISVSGEIYATPIAASNIVLIAPTAGDNLLVALNQDGTTKWSFTGK